MGEARELDPNTISYLGMIQGVINRMASTSATFKGLSVTLFAAVIAVVIATGINNRRLAILAVLLVLVALVFAAFDWYYFYQEKQYRMLYEKVLNLEHECDFDMKPPRYSEITRLSTLRSFALWAFYIPLIGISLILFALTLSII